MGAAVGAGIVQKVLTALLVNWALRLVGNDSGHFYGLSVVHCASPSCCVN